MIMRRHNNNKKDERHQHRGGGYQISRREREMLSKYAAREDADAKTQVPSGEIGGCGGATLRVGAEIDKQGIKRWKSQTKSQTAAQGNQQESRSSVVRAQGIAMMAHT